MRAAAIWSFAAVALVSAAWASQAEEAARSQVGAPAPSPARPFVVPDSMKALSPSQVNPPDVPNPPTPEFAPNTDRAMMDGFVMDTMEYDHDGEPDREIVAREFVAPLGATVGRKMPLNFSYDLMDLTGSGFNSLILWPRIIQLFPEAREQGEPVYVYDFDGKKWHLALKAMGMMLGVRPQFDPGGKPTGAMDLAMIYNGDYARFAYDKSKDEWHEVPKRDATTPRPPKAESVKP